MTTELRKSELEYDYLKFSGELNGFDISNSNHKTIVTQYLDKKGYIAKKQGDDWIYYENADCGMRAFVSNYPVNNKKIGRRPSLTLEFTGHFFIRENSDLLAREIVKFFTEKFGTLFKVNRVDIRQDIYGVKYPFDYLPDWTKKENKLIWALRGKPKQELFNHDMTSNHTGVSIETSRYKIMSYNRNISIKNRFNKGEVTKSYYNYYKSLYKGNQVQRLEIQLRQDACNLFTILFFNKEYNKEKILKFTMANFGRNHALKELEPRKSIQKMRVHEVFEELFYLKKKNDLKIFKKEFERKAGLKISEICFSTTGRSINEIIKMLGKKICESSQGIEENRLHILENTISCLKLQADSFRDIINDRMNSCKKTFSAMAMNLEEMMYARSKILRTGEIIE